MSGRYLALLRLNFGISSKTEGEEERCCKLEPFVSPETAEFETLRDNFSRQGLLYISIHNKMTGNFTVALLFEAHVVFLRSCKAKGVLQSAFSTRRCGG